MFLDFDGFNEEPLRGMQMLHAHGDLRDRVHSWGISGEAWSSSTRADWNVEVM